MGTNSVPADNTAEITDVACNVSFQNEDSEQLFKVKLLVWNKTLTKIIDLIPDELLFQKWQEIEQLQKEILSIEQITDLSIRYEKLRGIGHQIKDLKQALGINMENEVRGERDSKFSY